MGAASRIIKNTGWLYAKMAITMIISLYTTRLILNGLGASDFGIYNIVGGAIAMLGFINSSMASSTQRFMSYAAGEGYLERQKNIFNISYIIHIFLGLVAVIAFIIVGFFLFNGILNIPEERKHAAIAVYGSLIVSTFFSMISVPYEAVMNAHENMKYFAIVGVVESLMKLTVAFAVLYSPFDKLIYYGVLMAVIPVVTLTIMRIYCHCKYEECKISFYKYWDKKLAKEMTSFAGWGLMSSIAAMVTMQGMSILLNIFGGVVVNAAHGIANQLAGQLMVFSNNMLKALNPVLVKSCGAGENEKMLALSSTGNKLSFLIFSFFAVPFIIEMPYILGIWLKTPPEWAVLFVRLVLIRQMISQTYVTLETCISATGRIREMATANTVIWVAPLPISFFLYKLGCPIYTIYIVLIGTAFVRGANSMYFCKKLCGLSIFSYFRSTFLPCIIQLFVEVVFLFIMSSCLDASVKRLCVIVCMSVLLHLFLSLFITFNEREKGLIYKLLFQLKERLLGYEVK